MLKAVMIVYNQANTERVEYLLDVLEVRGFTHFPEVQGRGTVNGDPRRGTHAWPELNSAMLCIVDESKVKPLLEGVQKLDLRNKEVGVKAFVWSIEQMV